ncbi:pyridoxal phosphate-dependent aminotransferase [Siminovitchia terrae]|uniref:cysteine-S-conjugate beta-lyase n=1 Tax=Siminovitchia terrae TaxID=1914933 RepID=A0A429X630_SIMTE|nr:pyridoxal phosphate-dependent aminotransferase [Siminovitchia terrae]
MSRRGVRRLINFNENIDRKNTRSLKWDGMKNLFGREDLLPMWVADMDFRPPKEVSDALKEKVDHGIFGYTIVTESLNEAICDWTNTRHDWSIKPEWLLYSPGVIPSVHTAIQAFTEPGDKILVQSPVYTPFFHMIERNSREVAISQLILKNGRYEIDFDDFEKKLGSGVKMLLLSSPHNPAGRVWEKEELIKIAELCKKYNVLIASDEIHADLVPAPHKHIPIASLDESFADITLTFMAPTKTFNLAGVQASFMVVPNKTLRTKIAAVQASDGFSMLNTFGSIAMEAAYRHGGAWLDEVLEYIRSNIDYVKETISSQLPDLDVIDPEGTYLVWIDCRKLGLSDAELKKRILEKGKLALNFGHAYGPGGEGFVRMNVACPKETVIEGVKRLQMALGK